MATLAEALKSIGKTVRIPSGQKKKTNDTAPKDAGSSRPSETLEDPKLSAAAGSEEVPGSPLKRSRKRKSIHNEEEQSEPVNLDPPVLEENAASGSGSEPKFGAAKLCQQLTGLPTGADWKAYKDAGHEQYVHQMVADMSKLMIRMSIASHVSLKDHTTTANVETFKQRARDAREELVNMRVTYAHRVEELEKQLTDLPGLRQKVDLMEEANQEGEAARIKLEAEIKELKVQLSARRPEEAVLEEFRQSPAYATELYNKAALNIYTAFNCAKEFLPENPDADWEAFQPAYFAYEKRIQDAEREVASGDEEEEEHASD